ncbi:hypothetical protein [Flavobacterium kingsejongi]|uniref:hypothetical protein n=1 Tax=Flavobacterium kingsejongi TaxID=1678728 RepID=UPI0013007B6C|nr:hypothetical protein [Flavobacterium kingsejongi]
MRFIQTIILYGIIQGDTIMEKAVLLTESQLEEGVRAIATLFYIKKGLYYL